MAPRNVTQSLLNKADIQLAILSINAKHLKGNRPAATVYKVAETTLRRRRAGMPARRDCQPNSKKLTTREEVIVRYIRDLDQRGFAPT